LLSTPSFQLGEHDRIRYDNIVHDLGHFLTACLFALAASWQFHLTPLWSTVVGTVALPLVQEIHDYIRYRVATDKWGWPSLDSIHDPGTYQLLWALYFFQTGTWQVLLGFGVIAAYICYMAWYHISRTKSW
jgi:hypothetical protein